MGIDVTKCLAEISVDSPCGDDLEYDADFQELERSAQYKAEKQIGDAIVEAQEPDWSSVGKQSQTLFSRTKDLRVAMFLLSASFRTSGYGGLLNSLEIMHGLLDQYWDDVHPKLDPEDNNDPTMRINIISTLADHASTLAPLQKVPLVSVQGIGSYSIKDVDVASGAMPHTGASDPPDPGLIEAAFMEVNLDELIAKAEQVKNCVDIVKAIEELVTNKVGAAYAPDLGALVKLLNHVHQELGQRLANRGVDDAVDDGEPGEESSNGKKGGAAMSGEIKTSEDVIRMLDKICDYYAKYEPSSPLPLLLQRAKRLVRKDFIEILRDIAPDGLTQAGRVTGVDT
ncbi:MAG: type VI secretion system protein TssA [Gammaproteobacteria bacterium]|nr:type VI secretion system protein TssA [Gammaproteobacteria bacterium]MDH5802704.1 type VI secretion system protein TssA [Gammaproteobacteria bacterium]